MLDIIYENDDFFVINKPSGVVVNISKTNNSTTIQDLSMEYLGIERESVDISDSEFSSRAGIVHRLDKDTSGILLIAKNPDSMQYLQAKFKSRDIHKEYVAVHLGKLDDNVLVEMPIIRDPKHRTKYAISADGKPAISKFEKINEIVLADKILSVTRVLPKTGRTHQIRVHALALNAPIAGDSIYMTTHNNNWCRENAHISRLMLHAHKISFDTYSFEAPLPVEFDSFVR